MKKMHTKFEKKTQETTKKKHKKIVKKKKIKNDSKKKLKLVSPILKKPLNIIFFSKKIENMLRNVVNWQAIFHQSRVNLRTGPKKF